MRTILILAQPFRLATGLRENVRVADCPSSEGYGMGGFVWEPAITQRVVLSQETMSLELEGKVLAGRARFAIQLDSMLEVIKPMDLDWQGAPIQIWSADTLAWDRRVLEFQGIVATSRLNDDAMTVQIEAAASVDSIEKPLLILSFTGGGDEDGEPQMHNVLKPAGFGYVEGIEPVWFDETNNIGMIDGYGNTVSITRLLEGANDLGGPFADYADYDALKAAIVAKVIKPGFWGTCIAEGMVGLGAPPAGVIQTCALFGYDKPGSWMVRMIEHHAGVDPALIDTASFVALTAQVEALLGEATQTGWWTKDQRRVRDVLELVAGSCNATILVDLQNRVTVSRGVASASSATLDRTGSVEPRVIDWVHADTVPPFYELKARTARPPRVLSRDEVNFSDTFVPMGIYDPTVTYRLGNTVFMLDGSEWLYIETTPSAGNSPPTDGSESNTWWQQLGPPTSAALPGQTLFDATFRATWWDVPAPAVRMAWDEARSGYGALVPFVAATDLRITNIGTLDKLTAAHPGKALFVRISVNPHVGIYPLLDDDDEPIVDLDGEPVYDADEADFDLVAGIDWLDLQGDFISRSIVATADHSEGEQTISGHAVAPDGAVFANASFGYAAQASGFGEWIIYDPWFAEYQPSADNTIANQILLSMPPIPTVQADYKGAIPTDQFPIVITPIVTRGGVDVRTADGLTYAVHNVTTPGLTAVSVDNTVGVASKGQITINATMTGSFSFTFEVDVSGVATAPVRVEIVVVTSDPPDGTTTTGGGTGNKSGQFSLSGVTSNVFAQISDIIVIDKATGETIRAYAPLSYQTRNTVVSVPLDRFLRLKWRYAPHGTTTYTDLGSPVDGSVSTWDVEQSSERGEVICNQSAAPANGLYDVTLWGAMDTAGGKITGIDGIASVAVSP